jgi:hypothetical protein
MAYLSFFSYMFERLEDRWIPAFNTSVTIEFSGWQVRGFRLNKVILFGPTDMGSER